MKQKRKRTERISDTAGNLRLAKLPNSTLKTIARDKLAGANHKKVRLEKPKNSNDSYVTREAFKEFCSVTGKINIIKESL